MSGDVASIPSFARSGRPSFNLRSSSPFGNTSTAWRVRSAVVIGPSLVRRRLKVLDLHGLDRVGGLEAEELPGEREERLVCATLRLRAAKTVTLAFERDVRIRNAVPFERRGDRLGLCRRHDLVVEPLEEKKWLGDAFGVRYRRAFAVEAAFRVP